MEGSGTTGENYIKFTVKKGQKVVKYPPGTWALSPSYAVFNSDGELVAVYADDEEEVKGT